MRRLALLLLLVIACSQPAVDRGRWQKMERRERLLYVNSMLGAEQVKKSKGGAQVRHTRSADQYLEEIDAAYARGDQRKPDEIFAELADR